MRAVIIVKSVLLNKDTGRVLLIKRCKEDTVGAGTWENAGGNIEEGETPEDAIMREIREETGITDVSVERIAYVTMANIGEPHLFVGYLCYTQTENVTISKEHSAYHWANRSECMEMLPEPILEDMKKGGLLPLITDNP